MSQAPLEKNIDGNMICSEIYKYFATQSEIAKIVSGLLLAKLKMKI